MISAWYMFHNSNNKLLIFKTFGLQKVNIVKPFYFKLIQLIEVFTMKKMLILLSVLVLLFLFACTPTGEASMASKAIGGVLSPKCIDSDGGNNVGELGSVTVTSKFSKKVYFDKCVSNSTLTEYTCNGINLIENEVKCEEGKSCRYGSCGKLYECMNAFPPRRIEFSNAHLCNGDERGLTESTYFTLVATCGTPKCEYVCDSGFTPRFIESYVGPTPTHFICVNS